MIGAPPERLRVLIAGGHPREGIRAMLHGEDDIEVVGEASDGTEVPGLVEQLQPDVVVVDVMMPGGAGLEVTREVRRSFPETQVLVLSVHDAEPNVLEAFGGDAAGYLLKQAAAREVVRAVREVAAGRRYLCPPLMERAVEGYATPAKHISDPYETLTPREREVLTLGPKGTPTQPSPLSCSSATAPWRPTGQNAMKKLSLHTSTELVRYALRRGLISSDT